MYARRGAVSCRHALGVLGVGHLVLVDAVSVQVHRVQGQFVWTAGIPAVVGRVAAHLEAAGGDEHHFAGDNRTITRW